MIIFDRFHHFTTLIFGVLLLSLSFAAHSDDIQDANKLFKQGQYPQALNKVNGYLANKPKDAQARFLKGLILTEQDKIADAIKIFSSLTEDYPELPEPYNNLAVLYAKQGQYDKAKLALEMAIRTHPSYATAHENLGDIYAKMASQAYDRALQLDRSNTTTQTKLAMIQDLFADGKPTLARNTPVLSKGESVAPVVVATTTETPKPAQAEKSAPSTSNSSGEIVSSVNAWAAAWAAKNTKKYLSFYADDFQTPGGESRANWEAERHERVSKPKSIQVSIKNPVVTFIDNNHASVKFHQNYRASHFSASGNKTLIMVKSGNKWLIQEERSK